MRDVKKNAELIYQEFADTVYNRFKKERYGIGCCSLRGSEYIMGRKAVLDWYTGVYDEIFERIAVMENTCCDNGIKTAIALYGWVDNIATLSNEVALLTTARAKAYYVKGGVISIDYKPNTVPKILWMAELATEPVKTRYAIATGTSGVIGDPADLFGVPMIVGNYRLYSTAYLTQQTEAPVQFKVN
jgi:hypothetical protein